MSLRISRMSRVTQISRSLQSLQARKFSTTAQTQGLLDYFSFTRKNKLKTAEKSTKEVMQELETQDKDLTTQVAIPILGRTDPRNKDWKKKMNGFSGESWIPSQTTIKAELEGKQDAEKSEIITKRVSELHAQYAGSSDGALSDLSKRFTFLKQVQLEFGVAISDIKLTQLNNLHLVEDFVVSNLLGPKSRFNERFPNAIYLDPKEFEGTNISVTKFVGAKEKQKKFEKLVEQAKLAEQEALKAASA
ncbi:unnamed protein product [Kuraishia capsulata CBS 1993]|uniref:Large ribosomal subunit protein mL50 n=1 Tax=Kuraishia capsulata CBS 1993 TaxID=1382522 RepID=W6MQK3_9ASCO|nr:uncharacterized protein KUCA_T00004597001 [Kuraishia capsulata CBS 1993]CDK28613.1 unnamed protein product [Kuraishia capsulata CBS 1993]